MKKLFTFVAALILAVSVWAQSCPQRISYQAVVRNSQNQLVVGTPGIQVTVTIKEGTTTKYVETHTVTSNQNGLISLTVGEGTPSMSYPTMDNIDWSNATMVTAVTVPGEAPVEAITPVTAVPYALYSCEINPGSQTITNIYQHIGDTLNNYYTKNETKIQISKSIHDSIVNNISTQIHDTVMKHLTEYKIQDCDAVVACPIIKTMRDSIQINRASISNNYNRIQTNITNIQSNRDTIREVARSISNAEIVIKQGDVEVKKFTLNQTGNDTIKLPALPKQYMDIFTATADKTEFTLSKTPKTDNYVVKMYINGVMVGGAGNGVTSNPVISISGKAVTYTPANNVDACSTAYTLKAGDRVIFEYWY